MLTWTNLKNKQQQKQKIPVMGIKQWVRVGFHLYKILKQGKAIQVQNSCLWAWRGICEEEDEEPCWSVENVQYLGVCNWSYFPIRSHHAS